MGNKKNKNKKHKQIRNTFKTTRKKIALKNTRQLYETNKKIKKNKIQVNKHISKKVTYEQYMEFQNHHIKNNNYIKNKTVTK